MIVVWGSGTLGSYVCKELNKTGIKHIEVASSDISDEDVVYDILGQYRNSVLINCTGVIKGVEAPDSRFVKVNSFAPHMVAEACDYFGIKLIHVSTDCVFKGNKGYYNELDEPDATDIYGKSKALGEVTRSPHMTIRTSFIGFGKRGLLNWLLKQEGTIPGYVNTFWNGLTAPVLARYLIALGNTSYSGLLHIGGSVMDKCYLLQQCIAKFGLDLEVNPVEAPTEHRVNRSLVSVNRYMLPFPVPSLSEMLDELADEYSRLYK